MAQQDRGLVGIEQAPLIAVLGQVYADRRTGALRVFDRSGSVPFVFWFKRGFPCFSYSRDRLALLGEQLPPTRKDLVERLAAVTSQSHAGGSRTLLGQALLSEGAVTLDELQQALSDQVQRRLLCCASSADVSFHWDEGMDEFGIVPLSSPLLNPLEVAARAAAVAPYARVHAWVRGALSRPRVRLAMDRRIPPVIHRMLADQLVDSLARPQHVERLLAVPSHLRTLCVLLAFGYVEEVDPPRIQAAEAVATPTAPEPEPSADQERLSRLARLVTRKASHYEILGLAPTATRDEVKQAYRTLAFEIHPDRVPPAWAAVSREVFPSLVDAYHALSRERLRTEYDATLVASGQNAGLTDRAQVTDWLSRRRDLLDRIGLTTLAGEYRRMLVSVNGWPAATPSTDFFAFSRPHS